MSRPGQYVIYRSRCSSNKKGEFNKHSDFSHSGLWVWKAMGTGQQIVFPSSQISGIYCEGCNIYVVDAKSGIVKLVTRVTGVIKLLDYLGKLYISFSVHLKHQNYDNLSLPDAVGYLKTCADYFSAIKYQAISFQQLEPNKVTNGPKRTISNKTLKSV